MQQQTYDGKAKPDYLKHPIVLSNTQDQKATSFLRGYRQFWPFLRPYLPLASLGIFLSIPVGALDAVVAYFLKPFMDDVMIAQEQSFAQYVPVFIIAFTVVQGLLIYLAALVNGYVGGKLNFSIRTALYDKLLSFDSRFYDVNNSGSVIFRFFNDAESASSGLISNIRLFLTKFFSSVSLVCVLLYNSWQLTVLALGVLVILVVPLKIVRKRIKQIITRSVSGSTVIITLYNETTVGNRVIKVFNLKERMRQVFSDKADYLFRIGFKLTRDTEWLSPVMHLVSAIGVAGVLYYGVHLILTGVITSGAFVSFLAAFIMLYTPLKSIGNNYIKVQQALLALDRIYELLESRTFEDGLNEGDKILTGIKKSIEFKDVHFSYTDDREILKGVSFKVPAGKKIALVGNSGGGKTTVCSLIPRLYEADRGQILIDGIDITGVTLESLRSQIAMVFQDSFLFQDTIRNNIICAKPDATEEEIQTAIKSAYLDEFISSLPDGLDTMLGERGVTLSGGQKQRMAIARAIIKNAPLVILDEATSALDNKSEKVVQKALDSLMKGRTTIVIAHRLSTIRDSDLILVVNDGLIVERGTHEELLKQQGAYAALYLSQFKAQEDLKDDGALLEEAAASKKEQGEGIDLKAPDAVKQA